MAEFSEVIKIAHEGTRTGTIIRPMLWHLGMTVNGGRIT